MHWFIVFIFRSIMRINIRIGGNKKQGFSILFFFNLPNNDVGGSVNQSIIKKGLKAQMLNIIVSLKCNNM